MVTTPVQPPETWVSASFNTDKASGDYPLDVSFTDTSSGDPVPSSWHWNFGDGSAHVYTQNAMHTYTSAGTYTVTLTVRNSEGDEDTATTTIMVTTPAQPETWIVASFTPDVTSGNNPLTVVFTDASTGSPVPSSWHWDFGDGVQQDGQAATHTYVSDGDFTVTLTVGNSDGDTDAATAVITVMTPNPCPSPTGPSHITIALPPQSDMSYIYENNILSWIVTGPVNNPTITAYNLFVWGTGLFS
jgi:PKD repeat protein